MPVQKVKRRQFRLQIDSEELSFRQIEQYFRNQIETGALKEGDKLPSNADLASQFNVSGWTVQNALSRLAADGFLGRARRRGTFVKGREEKGLIAVLFGPSLADETAYFYRSVLKSLRAEMENHNWICRFYDGLTDFRGKPLPINSSAFRYLREDFGNYPFKGIIQFASGAKELDVLDPRGKLPKVVFSHPETDVKIDRRDFARQALDLFARRGRSRIAYLKTVWPDSAETEEEREIIRLARERKMRAPLIEQITLTEHISRQEEMIYGRCLDLVDSWKKRKGGFPDALLVGDDILARSVALALLNRGVDVPQDLLLLSLASAGVHLNYGLPVVRYEISPGDIASSLLEILKARLLDRATPSLPVLIPGRMVDDPASVASPALAAR